MVGRLRDRSDAVKDRPAAPVPPRARLRTYSHLAGARRVPGEYALVTSRLLFAGPDRPDEIETPLTDWYARYQRGSPLCADDWDCFLDPRATTYTRYTAQKAQAEAVVGHLFQRIEESDYDARLGPAALSLLEEAVAPLRYPWHALQMIAAYLGQMAPGGRIVVAATFQVGDELRRIQRIAYRVAQLRRLRADFAADSRARWERDPAWQPLREVIEKMLVAWDWGEAFAALDLCLKPLFDPLVLVHLGAEARARGDYLLGEVFASLDEDARWHREWSRALVEAAVAARPGNAEVLRRFVASWLPRCAAALAPLADAWLPGRHGGPALAREYADFYAALGLPPLDDRAPDRPLEVLVR